MKHMDTTEQFFTEFKEIQTEIDQLRERLSELIRHRNELVRMNKNVAAYSAPNRGHKDLIRFIEELLQQHIHPLSLQEIFTRIMEEKPGLIPDQIMDPRSYVKRHLLMACNINSVVRISEKFDARSNYFTLPSRVGQ